MNNIKINIINNLITNNDDNNDDNISNSQNQQNERNELKSLIKKHWNLDKIKFFDFIYKNILLIVNNSIKHIDKNIYFKNIHFFIKCIKNISIIKNSKFIKNNLYIYFRDLILIWYIEIFNND